jgi:hypothetical protein
MKTAGREVTPAFKLPDDHGPIKTPAEIVWVGLEGTGVKFASSIDDFLSARKRDSFPFP